jgi:integrase
VPGWNEALGAYALAQRAAGRAPGTISLHRHYLTSLAVACPRPFTVTTVQLLAFLAVDHWAPETRKSARGAVRGFYRWAHGAGHVAEDPSADLPTVRVPMGRARPAPEVLVRSLTAGGDRVAFMAALAAHAGLRRGEIARVHARDLVGDLLLVHGKGGRVREVPVVNVALLARLEAVTEWAFPNGLGSHLSPGHVGRLLSAAMPEGWSGHKLRHRCGTRAYAGTRDLLAVMELLGHSRPETTQRYVLLPDDAVRAAVHGAELAS